MKLKKTAKKYVKALLKTEFPHLNYLSISKSDTFKSLGIDKYDLKSLKWEINHSLDIKVKKWELKCCYDIEELIDLIVEKIEKKNEKAQKAQEEATIPYFLLCALAAKLAVAVERRSTQEKNYIKGRLKSSSLDERQQKKALSYWSIALKSKDTFNDYTNLFYEYFHPNMDLFKDTLIFLLEMLSSVKKQLHPKEEQLLEYMVDVFRLQSDFKAIKDEFFPDLNQYYKILGCKKGDSIQQIKMAFHKLIAEVHPDKLESKQLSPKMLFLAKEETQKLTKAYEILKEVV